MSKLTDSEREFIAATLQDMNPEQCAAWKRAEQVLWEVKGLQAAFDARCEQGASLTELQDVADLIDQFKGWFVEAVNVPVLIPVAKQLRDHLQGGKKCES